MAIILYTLWISGSYAHAQTMDIAGVRVPTSIHTGTHQLQRNGAGLRTKFIFKLYVCALYLEEPSSDAQQIIQSSQNKRISMDLLYGISGQRLNSGWQSGFSHNSTAAQLAKLPTRLKQFYAMFDDMESGESIMFDFLHDGSTLIYLHNRLAGSITGYDFQQALLRIWLGSKPADPELKAALLGQ